jgi:hypothetical protein
MKDKRLIILLDLDKVLVGTVPVNMSEINKAIDERKLVETQSKRQWMLYSHSNRDRRDKHDKKD